MKYGRHGKSGDEWRLVSQWKRRKYPPPPFLPSSSSASDRPHILPSTPPFLYRACPRHLDFFLSRKYIPLFSLLKDALVPWGNLAFQKKNLAKEIFFEQEDFTKAKRRTVSILDILYETKTCGTIPRLNIWTMRVPEYPTMRTLYPRLFCRLRGWEGLRLTIPFVALHMPACVTGVSPRYHKQRPKLNPAFQPPFSFPFYFLEFLLSSLRGEKTNGGRKVEIFFRICVTLAFRFFRPYLGVHGKRTVEGRRLSLLLNLISNSLIRRTFPVAIYIILSSYIMMK